MTFTSSVPTVAPGRVSLYEPGFAADPHAAYERMRGTYGPLVPVELAPGIPATLVIGYLQARRILNDPMYFPPDPRVWEQQVPASCPVRPMMEWRPNALRNGGTEHARYRSANTASINAVDQHRLRAQVEKVAAESIADFVTTGSADLLTQYAWPIAFRILSALLGCPDEIGARIADGMARIFNTTDAHQGNQILGQALADLVALRRRDPADDITSRLLAHPAELTDEEMSHQLVTLYGAGIEPLTNLIANTQLKILTDEEFSAGLHAGRSTVRDALDTVLYTDPPMANYCITYPPFPADIDGFLLPAHQPVVISMAACNNDPELTRGPAGISGNRAHLAWSIGPHTCPARSHAYLIAETAVTCLLDALPEMDLAVPAAELRWRPGPFHRALESLPVRFSAAR
ncbi:MULTISPECIES: cytochrome P450 [Streptomyces]|uniref:Cytochrome P450 n=1 Tax=Streptomyces poriferorum TaxID=2798799 RepID=A0ABY9IKQ4_9ACTN|nr:MULTISPECIES: cytochrome P450 [unclassified Streptomyces]MDP5315456.1 cytochrome P450 [Streptomyces sp. Alt4]WLQ55690.1 cytochrome P450 [Streptomyces sp. Alt2]